MKVGELLKKKRKELNLKVPELARRLGIESIPKIYKWEGGSNPGDFEDMKKVDDFIKNGLANFPERPALKAKISNAAGVVIDKETEILAYDRVILSGIAQVLALLSDGDAGRLEQGLLKKVEDERVKIAGELKRKS